MKRNRPLILGGLIAIAVFILSQVLFIVRQGDSKVLTLLGKPVQACTDAGLYWKWPWPIQKVKSFDGRLHLLETSYEESLTREGKNILTGMYIGWRIQDPILFLERVGSEARAETALDGLLRTYKNAAIGKHPFSAFVNTDSARLEFDSLQTEILAAFQPLALEQYGIDVQRVGLHRLGLPQAVTESVFERMKVERKELADSYTSEGESEAVRIIAQADSQRDQILSLARAEAKRARAEGDAIAAEHYQVFAQDPELARFLRKLETMEELLKERATVILSPDSEPFDLLKGGAKPLPAAPEANTP